MKSYYWLVPAIVLLGGCATSGPQNDIDRYAKLIVHCHLCAEAGMLDQETAAKGLAYAQSQVYRSDTERLQASGQRYLATGVKADQRNCTNLRLQILTALAGKDAAPATAAQPSRPTYTNCNTYFGQTFCTTY